MRADYHHTVLGKSTPSGEFTKRCYPGDTFGVSDEPIETVQDARRQALRDYIRLHFGTVNRFALALERKQPQINETLKGSRSFGEKLARALEQEIDSLRHSAEWKHLPPLQFDVDADSSARLRQLIDYFEAIPNEQSQNELIELARIKSENFNKSGPEAASNTQDGRESPARAPGILHPHSKTAPKKHRRA